MSQLAPKHVSTCKRIFSIANFGVFEHIACATAYFEVLTHTSKKNLKKEHNDKTLAYISPYMLAMMSPCCKNESDLMTMAWFKGMQRKPKL